MKSRNPFFSLSRIRPQSILIALDTILQVAKDTGIQMRNAQIPLVASSLAYTTILSIIPLLAVSFAIFNAFGGMKKLYESIVPLVLENLAQGTSEEVIATLQRFIDNTHAGAIGIGGLIGLIITSMTMLSSAEKAINRVWQVKLSRNLLHRIYAYWFFITLGPLALSVVVGMVTTTHLPLEQFLPSGTGMQLISISFFFLIYKWVPHVKVKSWCALVAAALTSASFILARLVYALYTHKIVSYNKVYGSLGAVPIILLWIYILWTILLGGAALTAALQKRVS